MFTLGFNHTQFCVYQKMKNKRSARPFLKKREGKTWTSSIEYFENNIYLRRLFWICLRFHGFVFMSLNRCFWMFRRFLKFRWLCVRFFTFWFCIFYVLFHQVGYFMIQLVFKSRGWFSLDKVEHYELYNLGVFQVSFDDRALKWSFDLYPSYFILFFILLCIS